MFRIFSEISDQFYKLSIIIQRRSTFMECFLYEWEIISIALYCPEKAIRIVASVIINDFARSHR